MKLTRNFLLNAALLQALTIPMLLVPSFAQQEIDPTWHDPWAITTPAVARPAQTPVASTQKTHPANSRDLAAHKQPALKHDTRVTTHAHKQPVKDTTLNGSL